MARQLILTGYRAGAVVLCAFRRVAFIWLRMKATRRADRLLKSKQQSHSKPMRGISSLLKL
jgi:hypothetical protein